MNTTRVEGLQAQVNTAAKRAAWTQRKIEIVASIRLDMAKAVYARNLAAREEMLASLAG